MLALPTDPRATSALLAWILGHVVVLLEDLVDNVVVDGEVVADAQNVRDRDSTHSECLVNREDAVVKTGGILGVRLASRRFEFRNFIGFTVGLSELLDPAATDFELVGHELYIQFVVNNTLTDAGDIILVQLHLLGTIERWIVLTKSFPDTTGMNSGHISG
jgi:hypothetical protein